MMNAEEIYNEYHKKVQNFIYGKVSDYYTAEDLASKVFIKILEKLDTFDETKASLSTWIYTIASNTVIDYYRVNHIHEEVDEELPAMDGELDEELLSNETLEELACALDKLAERERDLIVLHYYKNMTLKDIAMRMNMSYANAKVVHNKAIMKLRQYIPDYI